MKQTRLALVNERLLKHDQAIVFDGTNYQIKEVGIRGYTADRIRPERYGSIQSALDYLCSLCRDHKIASY